MKNYIIFTVHLNSVRYIKSRRLKKTGHVDRIEDSRYTFKIFYWKTHVKRLLGDPRRSEDGIYRIRNRKDTWNPMVKAQDTIDSFCELRVPLAVELVCLSLYVI